MKVLRGSEVVAIRQIGLIDSTGPGFATRRRIIQVDQVAPGLTIRTRVFVSHPKIDGEAARDAPFILP